MSEIWIVGVAVACSIGVGLGFGWTLRGRNCVTAPHRDELERLRSELQIAVGLQADKDARIATLEADLEAERTGVMHFEHERCSAPMARRQFG